jgi:peptidoglycan/xylan/chitin deacetylase (PgdA/CDA1 family)
MDKPVLMIHKIEKNLIVPKIKDFVLTFDDGLYNHFYYYPKIEKIETEKIFFVSTNIICKGKQSKKFISSENCHKKAFEGNYEDFMNVDQISYLSTRKNVIIGGHSHFHKNLNFFSSLKDKIDHIKMDTELMLEWFNKNLNIFPVKFCFPYNNDLNGLYQTVLKSYGINEFYGRERVSIEGYISS